MTKNKLLNLMEAIDAIILLVCGIFAFIYNHTTKGNWFIIIAGWGVIIVFFVFDNMISRLSFSERRFASEEIDAILIFALIIYAILIVIFGA